MNRLHNNLEQVDIPLFSRSAEGNDERKTLKDKTGPKGQDSLKLRTSKGTGRPAPDLAGQPVFDQGEGEEATWEER